MRKHVNTYKDFILEADSKEKKVPKKNNAQIGTKIAKKVQKKGEQELEKDKTIIKAKDGTTKSIPKDLQLKQLAKELYQAQYDVATFKYTLADKIAKMKENGADEDVIAKADELGSDQMTNVQLRADAIAQQMLTVAGANTNLAIKADEWAQGAINSALKAAQEFYDKRANKWLKDSEKQKAEKEKAKEEGEDSPPEKEDK